MYKRTLAAILLLTAALLSACGARSQVAGSTGETLYGYVQEINAQTRTVLVDEVELRTDDSGRPYAYNASRAAMLYPLASRVDYDFADNVGGNDMGGSGAENSGGLTDSGSMSGSNGDTGNSGGNGGNTGSNGNSGNNNSSVGGILGGGDNGDTGNGSGNTGSGSNTGSSYNGGTSNSNAGNSHESNDYYGGSGEVGGNSGATFDSSSGSSSGQRGNSVSGNTTVGNGTVEGPLADGGQGSGYAYRNVTGGLFSAFSQGPDRLTAYADRYAPLLCRLQLQDGQVVSISICTEANIKSSGSQTAENNH